MFQIFTSTCNALSRCVFQFFWSLILFQVFSVFFFFILVKYLPKWSQFLLKVTTKNLYKYSSAGVLKMLCVVKNIGVYFFYQLFCKILPVKLISIKKLPLRENWFITFIYLFVYEFLRVYIYKSFDLQGKFL